MRIVTIDDQVKCRRRQFNFLLPAEKARLLCEPELSWFALSHFLSARLQTLHNYQIPCCCNKATVQETVDQLTNVPSAALTTAT